MYERGREHFKIRTSPAFDALAPAEAAAQHTLQFLFNPARAARLVEFHARDAGNLGLEEVIDAVVDATWKSQHGEDYAGEIGRVVDSVVLDDLMGLAMNERAPDQVRAIAALKIEELQFWLVAHGNGDGSKEQAAHYFYAGQEIALFQKEPKKFVLATPAEPPDGPPIGDDEEF